MEVYFKREVLPHAPDAWVDHEKTKVGYETIGTSMCLRRRGRWRRWMAS